MAYFRCGGGGIPSSLKSGMNDVLNKKFGTSTTYAPATWPDNVNLLGPLPEKTVSGAVASFADGADDVPLKNCIANINRNLDGVSSVTVYQIGKNLFPFPISSYWETGNISDTTGKNVSNANNTRTVGLSPIPSGTTTLYILGVSNSGSSDKFRFFWYDENKQFLGYSNYANYTQLTVYTGARFFRMRYQTASGSFSDPCIFTESGQTYEAYKSKTPITVQLGRTIYGGIADVVNGAGTDNYARIAIADCTYVSYSTGNDGVGITYSFSENLYIPSSSSSINGGICSTPMKEGGRYYNSASRVESSTYLAGGNCFSVVTKNRIFIYLIGSYTEQEIKAATHDLIFACKKETSEDFTFTPTPINSYLGDNNIWCDTGDSSVTYRADIALALNQ